ncbi:MAG: glycosyltransferase [Candidatus Zambryskibacteria bacterium]
MISIVIPTCNEEKYIGRTIDCLLNLSLDKEIIVTDDASTDKTLTVLEKYGNKIKILTCEHRHKSIAANRNAGAKQSRGEFLAFLDSSTFIKNPNDFFSQALSIFEKDKDLVAITGKLSVDPELETFSDKIVHFFFNLIIMIKDNYLGLGEASGKFQMMKRGAFEKVGGFSENLITREDSNMFEKLSKIGKIKYVGSLEVFHTSRRAHALGWPKLLFIWMINSFWVSVFGKAKSKVWSILR